MTEPRAQFSYPIMLDLHDRLVVVVGAGSVGRRKLQRLLAAGARVRLVDPILTGRADVAAGVEVVGRCFTANDLLCAQLVFVCTDAPAVNQHVAAEAQRAGILCCRADQPAAGDFSLPAVLSRGALTVAVATGGGSPALAIEIRDRLAQQVPDSWGLSLELMAQIRRKWLTKQDGAKYNQQVLRSFWAEQLLPLFEQKKTSEIDRLLIETFGKEFSLEQLHVQLPEGIS